VSTAGVTVSAAEPDMVPMLATMFVVPGVVVVASPVAPIDATLALVEDHPARAVTSCVDPSANLPRAENCWFKPAATEADPGLTVIEVNGAGLTASVVEPVRAGMVSFAAIVVAPTARPVASPLVAPLVLIEAIPGADELQTAVLVTSVVAPLLNPSSAWNCCLVVFAIVGVAGTTAKETAFTAMPVPVSARLSWLGVALSVRVSVPGLLPTALGVSVTTIWQEASPGICVPQVLLRTA